ncbi:MULTISPECIES: hypothetical protein [unclassified Nocardiopsis]|uniref:hypothetical protein n=1 Tax=unclassified Nocardiopsis TaxID=2649073 RepID=UPI001F5B5730|nr:hypothetical protein [Nocardiopsis sp. TSRI0078]
MSATTATGVGPQVAGQGVGVEGAGEQSHGQFLGVPAGAACLAVGAHDVHGGQSRRAAQYLRAGVRQRTVARLYPYGAERAVARPHTHHEAAAPKSGRSATSTTSPARIRSLTPQSRRCARNDSGQPPPRMVWRRSSSAPSSEAE